MPTTSQIRSQICNHIIAAVAALISALAFSSSALAATLTSDQADYAPGSTAYITGSGFAQGETVQCQVLHIPDTGDNNTSPAHLPWSVTADAAGNFQTSWLVPIDQDEIGATLQLTATGQSSDLTAQTTFTDESCGTASISSVVGVGGACVQSATDGHNQFWDIAAGGTYTITLSSVTECSGDSIRVIVHSTALGNFCANATGGGGTYTFTYPAPGNGCDTENIEYCTSACQAGTGQKANDANGGCLGHLRFASFNASCVKTGDIHCGSGGCIISGPVGGELGCNPASASVPDCSSVTVSGCFVSGSFICNANNSLSGCVHSRHITASATGCDGAVCNYDQTFTWTVDTASPVIALANASALPCNPTTAQIAAAFGAATVTDNCSSGLTATGTVGAEVGTGCTCTVTKSWTVTDACGKTGTASQTVTFTRDTENPVITLRAASALACNPTDTQIAAAFGSATVTDNCSSGLTATGTIGLEQGTGCTRTVSKSWTVTDGCGNVGTAFQTVTFTRDTTGPKIVPPKDFFIVQSSGVCDPPDPSISGQATATDECTDVGSITITHSDVISGTCPKSIQRTWTAKDACGNSSTCVQKITCFCTPSLVTDTTRCTLPPATCGSGPGFNLIFTPDPLNISCYKLNASNPGQFYYNAFFVGSPGASVTFNVTLQYPFVTQGSNPIEVYDNAAVYTSNGQTCLTPGNKILAGSMQVTLLDYSQQAIGSTTTIPGGVTVTVPASGFVWLAVHLDYGLKGTGNYGQNAAMDAVQCTGSTVVTPIPNNQQYTFSVSGGANGSSMITSCNAFKKLNGIGGLVSNNVTTREMPGVPAALKDSTGKLLASGTTDQDGWYMCTYKWTGKAVTLSLTITPSGYTAQTKSVTLKSNGYSEVDFTCP